MGLGLPGGRNITPPLRQAPLVVRHFEATLYLHRKTDILTITSVDEIPSLDSIRNLPREKTLKLVFAEVVKAEREAVGHRLKEELQGFQVGIHLKEPEINIAKIITNKEVEENQDFFEQYAQDYRTLAQDLIFKLADKFEIEIEKENPNNSFYKLKREKKQTGTVGDWRYYLHGIHCGFTHMKTKQTIEVNLVHGFEFGDLDPYFFTQFIKSTGCYKPLPVEIYEDYADGVQIIEHMLFLGKFEKINLNNGFEQAVVVRRRKEESRTVLKKQTARKTKFNLLRFFGLK